MTYKVLALALLASLAWAAPQSDMAFQFAADAESYLKAPLNTEFSCEGLDYGYYADVNNNCQVFHICWPTERDGIQHWSFICGNQTIFDQATLTCNHETDAFPCEEAPSLFGAVEFGKVEEDY